MSTTSQAYGLIPVYHPTGQNRANRYNILNNAGTGYGTAIYKGDLVKLAADGTVNIGDGTSNALGVFAGCEYIDATGKPTTSAYWPASTALLSGTAAVAYVYDDPQTVYKVGVTANASGYVQSAIGDQVDIANVGTGVVSTGQSSSSVAVAAVGTGAGPAQVRVIGFENGEIYNATTNPYPQLLVQIVQHQFLAGAGQVAI
jgi:hypothetical protein